MERLFHSFLLISLSLILWSCHKDETGGGNTPKPSPLPSGQTITISDTSPTVSCEGNEVKIEFTVSEAWTADIINTRADTWVSISPKSGNAGAITMSISVNPNDTYDERGATIRIICGSTSKDIILTQKQKDAVVVTPSRNEFGAEGGKFSIEVKANVSYEYQIEEGCRDWIKDMTTKGLTSRTISFEVSENKKLAKREGSIIVNSSSGNEVVKIYQNGETPAIILTKNEYVVASEGETIQVEVRSNVNVSVEIPSDCGWISESNTKSMSTSTFNFIVSANTGYDERAAEIKFTNNANNVSETVKITQLQKDDDYLSFSVPKGQSDNAISLVNTGGGNMPDLEYSYDKEKWQKWDYSWLEFSDTKILYLRGDNPMGLSPSLINSGNVVTRYNSFITKSDSPIFCDGDIMSLISYKERKGLRGTEFVKLFSRCTALAKAPKLTATTLGNMCYEFMFEDCTNLTDAPELPAIELDSHCYDSMFKGCTSLAVAPKLPATTMESCCYYHMFEGCTNLVTAPELPALNLEQYCYMGMFQGCTSLMIAPELPALNLEQSCYTGMFQGCTSLAVTPKLPALKLEQYCYAEMFQGCTNLATVSELPATEMEKECCESMFEGCKSLITVPGLSATKLGYACCRMMFKDCENLISVPKLPATELTVCCYQFMFEGCTSLNVVQDLPATKLTDCCYQCMFEGCTSLTVTPKILATDLANSCCERMFKDCTGLVTALDLPALELAVGCYSGMFWNCISLENAPKLPALKLEQGCYFRMFQNCSKLAVAPELPATSLESKHPIKYVYQSN